MNLLDELRRDDFHARALGDFKGEPAALHINGAVPTFEPAEVAQFLYFCAHGPLVVSYVHAHWQNSRNTRNIVGQRDCEEFRPHHSVAAQPGVVFFGHAACQRMIDIPVLVRHADDFVERHAIEIMQRERAFRRRPEQVVFINEILKRLLRIRL